MSAYGSRTVERRHRRTRAELDQLDDAIVAAVAREAPCTLRRVYYCLVAEGVVVKDATIGYRPVQRELLKLRRAGVIPYRSITDGTRYVIAPAAHRDPQHALDAMASSYRRLLWADQPVEVHVFTESDALSGVVYPVVDRYQVPLGVLRGYQSETFAYSVADDLVAAGRPAFVYQVGDHDPSGVSLWRTFVDRVRAFAPTAPITFERLAITPEQIESYGLPTYPKKGTDPRARGFVGETCEVDALPAPELRAIVERAIEQHINPHAYALHRAVEDQERAGLDALAGRYFLEQEGGVGGTR